MDKFWVHVDYLIPEDQKIQISEEDAEKRIRSVNSQLSKIQTK
jgi:hypothetical protein